MADLMDLEEQRRRARGAPPIDTSINVSDAGTEDVPSDAETDEWAQRKADQFPAPTGVFGGHPPSAQLFPGENIKDVIAGIKDPKGDMLRQLRGVFGKSMPHGGAQLREPVEPSDKAPYLPGDREQAMTVARIQRGGDPLPEDTTHPLPDLLAAQNEPDSPEPFAPLPKQPVRPRADHDMPEPPIPAPEEEIATRQVFPDAPPAIAAAKPAPAGGAGDEPPPEEQGRDWSWLQRLGENLSSGIARKKADHTVSDAMHRDFAAQQDRAAMADRVSVLSRAVGAPAGLKTPEDVRTWLQSRPDPVKPTPENPSVGLIRYINGLPEDRRASALQIIGRGEKKADPRDERIKDLHIQNLENKVSGGGAAAAGGADEDAVEAGAEYALETGKMLPLGSGASGLRAAILSRIKQKQDAGDPRRLPAAFLGYAGRTAATRQQAQGAANIDSLAETLNKDLDLVKETAGTVPSLGIPWLDQAAIPAQSGLGKLGDAMGGNSVAAQRVQENLITAQGNYARLLASSAGGTGQPSDQDMRTAARAIHMGMTPEQIEATRDQIRKLTAQAKAAKEGVLADQIRPPAGTATPPAAPPATGDAAPVRKQKRLADGTVVTVQQRPDGKWEEVE